MNCVGATLLCDSCHESMIHHMEEAPAEALRIIVDKKATDAGWQINAKGARCPACVKKVLQ